MIVEDEKRQLLEVYWLKATWTKAGRVKTGM